MGVAAGWYPDPALTGRNRWWDGNNWTEQYELGQVRSEVASPAIPDGWYNDGSGRLRWFQDGNWTQHVAEATPQTTTRPITSIPESSAAGSALEIASSAKSLAVREGKAEREAARNAAKQEEARVALARRQEKTQVALARKQGKAEAAVVRKHENEIARANRHYAKDHAKWEADLATLSRYAGLAHDYTGGDTDGIVLKAGERAFYTVNGVSLVEYRAGAREYIGRSSGVSVPIGFGMRYRVGQSRGRVVQAPPQETAIDTGVFIVTNQRAVFRGAKQTRECLFSKLVGYDLENDGDLIISVSNRQKPTQIRFSRKLIMDVGFYFELALSHFNGTVQARISELDQLIDEHRRSEPQLAR